jgi:pyruvate formate lyase activating enzyme
MEHTGIIFDVRRFCIHDGPGIRTTVFFKGCPLDCWWCHNPEGRSASIETFRLRNPGDHAYAPNRVRQSTIGFTVTVNEVVCEVMRDEPFYDQSGGVTFSGGEPMAQIDFLDQLLDAFTRNSIHCTIDTCGYAPLADFERIYDRVNLFLFDLKLMHPEAHRKYTGVSNEIILTNLARLAEKGSKVEIRLPLIPNITDTQGNLEAVVSFLGPLQSIHRISLLPYNKLGEDKTERFNLPDRNLRFESQDSEILEQKASFLRGFGYEVRIGG